MSVQSRWKTRKVFQSLLVTIGVAFSVVGSAVCARAQVSNLGAAYGLNEGTGASVADTSGNGNTGTVTGASWGTGQFGKALVFSGNASVMIANSPSLDIGGTALTVELWVNISAAASGSDYTILAKPWMAGSMPAPYYQYAVEVDANGTKAVQFFFGNTSGQLRGPFSVTPTLGTWAHIAFTYNGAQVKGYLNGAVVVQTAETASIQTRGAPLRLGVDGAGGQGYKGSLDEVRIYSRALSQSEIQADMNTPIGGGGGGDTTAPTVSITSPTANPTYSTSSSLVNLGGTAGDNVGVTQVTWVNNRGGSGTASGTTSWTVTGIALQVGTNVVTVTARDAANNTATDTLTVTSTPPAGNLAAAYNFDEGSGTTVTDASGNNNTGTGTGTSWGTGQFGKALVFGGNTSVMIANSPSLNIGGTGLTLELWVNISAAASSADYAILAKPWVAGSMTAPYYQYAVEVDANGTKAVQFFFGNTSGQLRGPFKVTPPFGTWTHVAFTYNGAQVKGYMNGALVLQTAETSSIQTQGTPLRLGVDGVGGQGYKGSLDEVRIYSRALTQTEIQADMRVSNPTGSQVGQWDGPFAWPIVAVHAALLPNGKVLAWDFDSAGQGVQVWNPTANTFTSVPYNVDNLFCAGLALLRDGKVLVAGGHVANYVGITGATLFNPVTQQWTATAPMSYARWYPTVTALPDGRVLVTSGSINCHTCTAAPEIYNPMTGTWTRLTNATLAISLYPHQFVLPDGRVLVTGSYESSQIPVVARALNVNTQTWTTIDPVAVNGGSAATYLPGKVVTSGLGTTGGADVSNTPSTATTYVLDMMRPSPAWRQTASMAFARDFHNLTLLPDGKVLVTGGGTTIGASDPATAVLDAELWSPVSETWTTMARMQVPRRYHSIALLLPDGRVLVAGGGRNYPVGSPPNLYDRFNAEIFSPPYLFKGVRPTITSTPATLQYNTNFSVVTPDAARIASVSLVRLGTVTHAINMNQRFLNLMFQQVSGGLTVQAPANANLAPPGDYMLFILDTNGVPSVASMVRFP